VDFEEMRPQKSEQFTFDFSARGEARKRWSKGRLVSAAATAGEAKADPPAPALAQGLIEAMLSREKLERALRRVEANRGAPGVDGMRTEELRPYLRAHWGRLTQELLEGRYRPQPVKRVEIPKPEGGVRELGIPTVVDRFIQQLILQVMEPLYEPTFSAHSYGFRPGKSAHQALEAAREHVAAGHGWVVDLDLERFFDRVNHDVLMGRIARRIGDKRLLKLLRRYLQAGVMVHGVVIERYEGTPQGGPLSPLLSNILLDELDRELERRGHRFCRYADDCNIYVKTERAGQRVMESVTKFLESKLRLKVNRAKSAVGWPSRRKFLGLRIVGGARAIISIAPQSLHRLRAKVRRLTRRNRGVSLEQVIAELGRATDGWVGYFGLARTPTIYQKLDEWIRRRLRCYLYKQWKKPRNRARQIIKLGVGPWLAWGVVMKGYGPWKVAGTPAMTRALTNERLERMGYSSLYRQYLALPAS
jgi:RNA-directed DNA polymerase